MLIYESKLNTFDVSGSIFVTGIGGTLENLIMSAEGAR